MKVKVALSVGNFMANIFLDSCVVNLIEYLERSHTVTADCYSATLTRLREAIRHKSPGMLSDG